MTEKKDFLKPNYNIKGMKALKQNHLNRRLTKCCEWIAGSRMQTLKQNHLNRKLTKCYERVAGSRMQTLKQNRLNRKLTKCYEWIAGSRMQTLKQNRLNRKLTKCYEWIAGSRMQTLKQNRLNRKLTKCYEWIAGSRMQTLKQNRLNRRNTVRMVFIFWLTAGFSFVVHSAPKGVVTNPGKSNSTLKPSVSPARPARRQSEREPRPSSLLGRKNNIPFARSLPEDISNENFPDIIESFDYPNAPLMDLIQAVGKLTGMNFIIDPGVASKKITIIAPSKITVAEAYKAFLSALAANGYTIVKSGAFWKIRETKTALKDNTEIYSGGYFPNTDQLITRIIRLKHINAGEFSKSIKPLASAGQQVSSHDSSNTIIISDYGSVIERIMKLVRIMDVPGSEETVQIVPVLHASAGNLAEILSELLGASRRRSSTFRTSRSRSSPKGISASLINQKSGNIKVSHIIPDERTNSLIISANKNGMKRVKGLIKKLDTYVDGGVYVYNVLYGTAEQVYNTLMGISPSKTSGREPIQPVVVTAPPPAPPIDQNHGP